MTENTSPGPGAALADDASGEPMLRVADVHHSYGTGAAAVHALRGASFAVRRGELVALKGRSGSGKTTLLHLIGGLDTPQRGRVVVGGTDLSALSESELLALRRDRIGFVFQSFGLIPILTAAENVGVPLRLRRAEPRAREERVALLLALWDSPATRGSGPPSSPAGSSSASPSPGPSPTARPCCSPTSRPASSTPPPAWR
ncbi:hypothetical protein GCM10010383_11870 [Streptomyces lomondensis]|uniref:ABC transporter domain-containing protein n=1 Tax=Streptomyces lomondensis TaxID=68229 RepID=A0ABQ2WWY0_9ACTN|nr:hypothetical protein GCM10010383_11870 [Streptomyces lomondensis]